MLAIRVIYAEEGETECIVRRFYGAWTDAQHRKINRRAAASLIDFLQGGCVYAPETACIAIARENLFDKRLEKHGIEYRTVMKRRDFIDVCLHLFARRFGDRRISRRRMERSDEIVVPIYDLVACVARR